MATKKDAVPADKQFIETICNDIEVAEVYRFNENKTLVETIRKVLLAGVYFNGTLRPGEPASAGRNFALSLAREATSNEPDDALGRAMITDEQLGADLRATMKAIRLVESAFAELGKLKAPETRPETGKNPGR